MPCRRDQYLLSHMFSCLLSLLILAAVLITTAVPASAQANENQPDESLEQRFATEVQPLLAKYCASCHNAERAEAEVDLTPHGLQLQDTATWLKVRTMLQSRQMPPREAKQPSDEQYRQGLTWVKAYLSREAAKLDGDPGPVLLRRLSNAEYNYAVRDLTGIMSLDPTREFPVDGAAGEGFTNTGSGQGMSPALVNKYLDAAKEVSQHMVLLPDGIRFSTARTRRDQTDELLAQIQQLYHLYAVAEENGAAIPLSEYVRVSIIERDGLLSSDPQVVADTINRLTTGPAASRPLSPVYLEEIRRFLREDDQPSFLLRRLRDRWLTAGEGDVAAIVSDVATWQQVLWKLNTIGHIGRKGGPPSWLQAVNPVTASQNFQFPVTASGEQVVIRLSAGDAGDGNDDDWVRFVHPRFEAAGKAPITLRDAAGMSATMTKFRRKMLDQLPSYFSAAAEASPTVTVQQLAERHNVDPILLSEWLRYLTVGVAGAAHVENHFTAQMDRSGDYGFIQGWGSPETPLVLANSSDQQVRIPGIARPRAVVVHPSPTHFVAVAWQSPRSGKFQVKARIADAHPECGNGVEWFLQHESSVTSETVWQGTVDRAGAAEMPPRTLDIQKGELLSFKVGPKQNAHACDLTAIDLTLTAVEGDRRSWDLGRDVSGSVLAANPHADSHGNDAVWHFYSGDMKSITDVPSRTRGIPEDSLLAHWLESEDADQRNKIALQISRLVQQPRPPETTPDRALHDQLWAFPIPANHPQVLAEVPKDPRFGKAGRDLLVKAPVSLEFVLPAELLNGRQFITQCQVDPEHAGGSIQAHVSLGPAPADDAPNASTAAFPIVVTPGSAAEQRVLASFDAFRELFPAAVSYDRIVPVDEVVTLTLFYREDEHYQRLFLTPQQRQTLDRLWRELRFVSQEPLQYLVALEQIREFATQDRPDLVVAFEANIQPANERAEAFRSYQRAAETRQLEAILKMIPQAWRRPVTDDEVGRMRRLYHQLRDNELDHEAALKLTLARILTSPDFLFKIERPGVGTIVHISDHELANRLSFFLWSSIPDAPLTSLAERGELQDERVLSEQIERMLNTPRTRRLAIEFACQWLHLRGFDQNDDKNEELYPEFASLRGDMYEETVRFFEDMFRRNGSVLDLLDADHSFLNDKLAAHYGIAGVSGSDWRRVTGLRREGRGGVLGMATVLASQSGASRTSPILRGNWISETLLGERLPRPPADVPQLPDAVPDGLTARQLIERHSADPACATCHARIDPYGFALEQFDAIGRTRSENVDTSTTLLEGEKIQGLDGIRRYLAEKRRDDVVRQFCRKLLGFALGRELRLSDEPLVEKILTELRADDYRFQTAVKTIVLSQPFRSIRGTAFREPESR